jgi:hypothetical protein
VKSHHLKPFCIPVAKNYSDFPKVVTIGTIWVRDFIDLLTDEQELMGD